MTEAVPFTLDAAMAPEEGQLLGCFHPFCHYLHALAMGHCDDAGDDRGLVLTKGYLLDERPVDLDRVNLEILQPALAGGPVQG